jgi:transposase
MSKSRTRIKILYWDKNGFCLWQKRLEKDRFPWIKRHGELHEITTEQLEWLLSGIDFWNAHKELFYENIG